MRRQPPPPDAEALAGLLALMARARPGRAAVLEQHLDEDQVEALVAGAQAAGPARHYLLEVEWPRLYRRAEALRVAGTPVTDAEVQRVVARLDELSALFSDGRPDAGAAVRDAWRDHPAAMSGEPAATAAGWTAVADFVEQARAAGGRD